ncbi:MAG: hypothetical protein LBK41_08735 [Clostridiales bacterium]|nr:hypothetical protein [Clostridiales bacterium]
MKKLIVGAAVSAVIALSALGTAFAADPLEARYPGAGSVRVIAGWAGIYADGEAALISAPVYLNEEGALMVPIQPVADAFGGYTVWRDADRTVLVVSADGKSVVFNSTDYVIDGGRAYAESAAFARIMGLAYRFVKQPDLTAAVFDLPDDVLYGRGAKSVSITADVPGLIADGVTYSSYGTAFVGGDGRLMLPLRGAAMAVGVPPDRITWSDYEKKAIIQGPGTAVMEFAGEDGSVLIDGRIYTPCDEFAKSMYLVPELSDDGRTVRLSATVYTPFPGRYEGARDENGFPHGDVGRYEFLNGDVYVGGFLHGLMSGKGKLYYAGGAVYEGDFSDGTFNGKGAIAYSGGSLYVGDFKDGQIFGEGKFTYVAGGQAFTYEGRMENGIATGWGALTSSAGKYEGLFANSMAEDENGKYTYANGDIYVGGFAADKREGAGTYTYKRTGRVVKGVWRNDVQVQ